MYETCLKAPVAWLFCGHKVILFIRNLTKVNSTITVLFIVSINEFISIKSFFSVCLLEIHACGFVNGWVYVKVGEWVYTPWTGAIM